MERRPLVTQGTRGQEDERVEEMTLRVVAGKSMWFIRDGSRSGSRQKFVVIL